MNDPLREKPEQPATRGDLADVRDQLTNDLAAARNQLTEAIRDSQTEVLRAFYGFSRTLEARLNMQDNANNGLRERMNALESRILTIEEKLHLPPEKQGEQSGSGLTT